MQVRAFIMPDQVALMLSAADWLSDRPRVSLVVCVFAHRRISCAFQGRYVAVVKVTGDAYLRYFEELLGSRGPTMRLSAGVSESRMHSIYLSECLRESACDL